MTQEFRGKKLKAVQKDAILSGLNGALEAAKQRVIDLEKEIKRIMAQETEN